MPLYTQFNRPLKITTPLRPDALLLVKLTGVEAISELYCFEAELLAPNYTTIDFSQILAKDVKVTLTVPNAILPIGVNRYFHGVVMLSARAPATASSRPTTRRSCRSSGCGPSGSRPGFFSR